VDCVPEGDVPVFGAVVPESLLWGAVATHLVLKTTVSPGLKICPEIGLRVRMRGGGGVNIRADGPKS
jgi:hypothetical protein